MAELAGRLSRMGRGDFQGALDLAGLADAGPPIPLRLEPEGTPVSRAMPEWVAGYAEGDRVVLFPARAPRYPDGDITEVLQHEVAHVLVARAARGGNVPRWFNEGVAMFAGRPYGLVDRARLALALVSGARPRLADVEALFQGDHASVARAYAISGAFVHDAIVRYGASLPGRVLRRIAEGETFGEAYRRETGAPLALDEERFYRRGVSWESWLSLLANPFTVWGLISLLALLAIWIRHRRDAAIRRRWELQEARQTAEPEPEPEETVH